MTQFTDPVRWTVSGEDAPEGLREMFAAGRAEGPSGTHMRALSLKLAAAVASGAGAAAAGVAVKPLASALTGTTVKSAFAGAKLLAAMTVAGAVTLGGAVAYRVSHSTPTFSSGADVAPSTDGVAAPAARASTATAATATSNTAPTPSVVTLVPPSASLPAVAPSTDVGRVNAPAVHNDGAVSRPTNISGATTSSTTKSARATTRVNGQRPAERSAPLAAAAESATATGNASHARSSHPAAAAVAPASELSLLRQAQAALSVRPREAFALTQKHRAAFPQGQFAEERDALAIQALLRAGEREEAIDLAERFVAAHPKSAHAHKVRELLNSK